MTTKSNLVSPDDFGSAPPNSNSAFSGSLPPMADSISSLDGFINSFYLENAPAMTSADEKTPPKETTL